MPPYLIPFLALMKVTSAACYAMDNSMITSTDYQPCNSISGSISMCCALNRPASGVLTPDTCLSNGLCQNIFTNQTTLKPDINYWREGCSDSGWNSKYCLAGICASSGSGDAELTPCDGTSTSAKWCCGTHNTACCGTGQEIVLAATLGAASAPPTTATTAAATATTGTTGTTGTTSQNSPTSSSSTPAQASSAGGLSTGAIVGVAIGCVALVGLGVLAGLCFWRRKSKSSQGSALLVDGHVAGEHQGTSELHGAPKMESTMPFLALPSEAVRSEMPGDSVNPRSELA